MLRIPRCSRAEISSSRAIEGMSACAACVLMVPLLHLMRWWTATGGKCGARCLLREAHVGQHVIPVLRLYVRLRQSSLTIPRCGT